MSDHPLLPLIEDHDDSNGQGDRRTGARHLSVMRIVRLDMPSDQGLCLVRNISSGGLMAHVYDRLDVGDSVIAHFKSGFSPSGKVVWRRDAFAGVQFDHPIDVAQILGGDDHSTDGQTARAPRVPIDVAARVRIGALYRAVKLVDISLRGCKIETDHPLVARQQIVTTFTGLPAIAGTVRWTHDDLAGIAFDRAIAFDVLARWLADLNAARSPDGPERLRA